MKRIYSNMIIALICLYIAWRGYYWYAKGYIVPVYYAIVFIAMVLIGTWIYRWQAKKEEGTEVEINVEGVKGKVDKISAKAKVSKKED